MKRLFFFGILLLLGWACSPSKHAGLSSASITRNGQDSTEYEALIIDPGFDQWYLVHYSPAMDFSDDTYRSRIISAVVNWNDYFRTGRYPRIVENFLDYRPNIDYGIEVNRKLYWYFKYLESTQGIKLF